MGNPSSWLSAFCPILPAWLVFFLTFQVLAIGYRTLLITEPAVVLAPTVYPKKYAHGFCFAVLCCGYTLTDFPISIRLTSLALWQSNDCPSASKATLMNMDKYFMWIHYERLHNHNKAKHNKTVCIFLGIYCIGARPPAGYDFFILFLVINAWKTGSIFSKYNFILYFCSWWL